MSPDPTPNPDPTDWTPYARPTHLYRAIVIDPPWPERGGGKVKRGADRHYRVLKTKPEILHAILASPEWRPHDDSHLYMWVTNNYLPWGLWLMDALGYSYKTNWPWTKPGRAGIGQYARGRHELLLFGTRGKGYAACSVNESGVRRKNIDTAWLVGAPRVVSAETGKIVHSAKPPQARELVEARSIGPYLEMFARGQAPDGWTFWGDQAV